MRSASPIGTSPDDVQPRDAASQGEDGTSARERSLIEQIARLEDELGSQRRYAAEAAAASQKKIAALTEAFSAIRDSTTWRLSGPIRKLASRVPESVRLAAREWARNAYWLMTPHKMPARRRWVAFRPVDKRTDRRLTSLTGEVRVRLGMPLRRSYGPTPIETLDLYPTTAADAPIFVFIHGAAGWETGSAGDAGFPAEMFVRAGAHFIVPDFVGVNEARGDLRVMAQQIRRAIAWAYSNAASFGGDPNRLFIGGYSSGGHLAAVALLTDWTRDFGLPGDIVRGGLLMSGIFEMKPVRYSSFNRYLSFDDEIEDAMSPQRHVQSLRTPITIVVGSDDTPEIREQGHAFFNAVTAAGKPAELIEAANFGHVEIAESLGNPYGPGGRAALQMMGLSGPGARG